MQERKNERKCKTELSKKKKERKNDRKCTQNNIGKKIIKNREKPRT